MTEMSDDIEEAMESAHYEFMEDEVFALVEDAKMLDDMDGVEFWEQVVYVRDTLNKWLEGG